MTDYLYYHTTAAPLLTRPLLIHLFYHVFVWFSFQQQKESEPGIFPQKFLHSSTYLLSVSLDWSIRYDTLSSHHIHYV